MNSMFSMELISIISIIFIIAKFKLNQKFTVWLLKGVKIYLPPTDKDYQLLCDLKKEKNKNANGIIRICKVDEYVQLAKDENCENADLVIIFYLTSLTNLIIIELVKICKYYYDSNYSLEEIDEENPVQVGASFVFISITYIIYVITKNTFKNGFKSYDAKIFAILFLISLFIIFSILYSFEKTFDFDDSQICRIVNDRLESISNEASDRNILTSHVNIKICNRQVLNCFYAFVFSFTLAIFFKSCIRMSYFDDLFLTTTEKSENMQVNSITPETEVIIKENLKNSQKIKLYSKFKQIIVTLMPLLFIDQLLKNYIVECKLLSEFSYFLCIMLLFVIIEFILGFILLKYYSTLFLNQNYYIMNDFSVHPEKSNLPLIRSKMNYMNSVFWEIFIQLFFMLFLNLLVFMFYINRSNITNKILNQNVEFRFRSNFMDTYAYFLFLAIVISKALFTNAHTFYLKKIKRSKKNMLIL